MHIGSLVRRAGALTTVALLALPVLGVQGAGAAPVGPSEFTCGVTVFTPCNQTAHFSDLTQVGTPITNPAATNCPPWVFKDFVGFVGTGNGVEHSIINNAGDGWFTSTETGKVTVTAYPPSSVDNTGPSPVIKGLPDPAVPVFTGQLTEWFGGSFNRSNRVLHSTFHFSGTAADGSSFRILDVSHMNTTPNTIGPPHSFEITSC